MAYEIPTLTEIDERIQADLKTRIEGAVSFLRRSVLKIQARVYAGAVRLLYGYLKYQSLQLFVLTSDSEELEIQGNELGVTKTKAVEASGTGTATGSAGLVIPANTELESNAGYTYYTDVEVTFTGTTASVDFTAAEAGANSNDDGGILLSFVSPIAGVTTTITVDVNGIDGGTDEETDEAFRQRVLTRKRQPPHGGAEFDYENWALEISGVTRAWSFPQYQGDGTIGLAFVRDNDESIIPSAAEVETVRAYIEEHTDPLTGLQVGYPVDAALFMITLTLDSIDMTIQLNPNTAVARAEVTEKIEDFILSDGGPGETLTLSNLSAAISLSANELSHRVIIPTDDIATAINKVPVLGTITFQDYA